VVSTQSTTRTTYVFFFFFFFFIQNPGLILFGKKMLRPVPGHLMASSQVQTVTHTHTILSDKL
jgi:hypothetical protein